MVEFCPLCADMLKKVSKNTSKERYLCVKCWRYWSLYNSQYGTQRTLKEFEDV